jgi:PHD/YefM family antitoxin component YafN of YafNO toxin-antitoxin module
MRQISSDFLKKNLAEVLRLASLEPIVVIKTSHPRAVIVSPKEYENLTFLRGLRWLVTQETGIERAVQEASLRDLLARLTVLSERVGRPVCGIIHSAIEEKVEELEGAMAVQGARNEAGKRWTLLELMTLKDLT